MSMVDQAGQATFNERLSDFVSRVEYRRVVTPQERRAIFKLRHDCYLREGAIEARPSGLFRDRYDFDPNVWIFGVHVDGALVGSVRIHVASKQFKRSPGMTVFKDLLGPRLEQGQIVVDPTRFVVSAEASRDYPLLPHAVLRLCFMACDHFEADVGLATVRTEHRGFYRRFFAMESMSEPRFYPSLKKPITMMGVDFFAQRNAVMTRYPFFASTASERGRLFGKKVTQEKTLERSDFTQSQDDLVLVGA
jgi:N-acyl-L-homoserine lactone synthetase